MCLSWQAGAPQVRCIHMRLSPASLPLTYTRADLLLVRHGFESNDQTNVHFSWSCYNAAAEQVRMVLLSLQVAFSYCMAWGVCVSSGGLEIRPDTVATPP